MTKSAPAAPDALTQPFRHAVQIGVVVRDLEQSMAMLTTVFGIGPFRVVDCPAAGREHRQFLRGEPVRYRSRQAFADLGTVELELIEPLEGPTIWAVVSGDPRARHPSHSLQRAR